MRIDSHSLEAFLTVARYGTFSRAAEQLRLSQSAVSQRIRLMEYALNLTLIDRRRGRSNVTLTPAGQKLLPFAERWELLQRDLERAQLGGVPTINIGASASVSDFVLLPMFSTLSRDGLVNINLHVGNSPELYERLARHELDMAFVLHSQRTEDATIAPILREKLAVVSKDPLPLRDGLVDNEQLDPSLQINFRFGSDYEDWHARTFGGKPNSPVTLSNIHLLGAYLSRPQSWAIVPTSVGYAVKDREGIDMHMMRDPPPDRVLFRVKRRQLSNQSEEGCAIVEKLLKTIALPPLTERLNGDQPAAAGDI